MLDPAAAVGAAVAAVVATAVASAVAVVVADVVVDEDAVVVAAAGKRMQSATFPGHTSSTTAAQGTSNLRVQCTGDIEHRWHHLRPVASMHGSHEMVGGMMSWRALWGRPPPGTEAAWTSGRSAAVPVEVLDVVATVERRRKRRMRRRTKPAKVDDAMDCMLCAPVACLHVPDNERWGRQADGEAGEVSKSL